MSQTDENDAENIHGEMAGVEDAPAGDEGAATAGAADLRAQEMEDRWLRTAAEFENFRKRAARERETASARASDAELAVIVRLIDDLERAVQAAAAETATVDTLRDGFALVLQQARAALGERGVEILDPQDAPFDPALHEAVLRNPDGPVNTVTRVLARGYRRDGRVLRPAQVEVGG